MALLLGTAELDVGRLVFTEGALPAIRPVNYFVHEDDIIVRTSPAGTLSTLDNQVVAFEIDHIEPDSHTGWSVVAVGKVEHVTDIDTTLGRPVTAVATSGFTSRSSPAADSY